MAQLNFDATSVDPSQGQPDPIPAGYYDVQIDESDIKPTTAGDGSYVELRMNILGGQYANRKLFARLNINNPNPIAQEIGRKELSAIGYATGVLQIADSQQLHGIPFQVKVKIRPAKGDYDASNDIVGFYASGTHPVGPTGGAKPVQNSNPFANQSQPQTQGGNPWGNQQQNAPQAQNTGWNGQPQQTQPEQQQVNQQQQNAPQGQAWGQPVQQQQTQQQNAPVQQQQGVQGQTWSQGDQQAQPWANGQPQQQQQVNQQQQQQVQQQNQAPITQQPANYNIQEGQTAQTSTPPWAQQ